MIGCGDASAQIERRQLPVIQGEPPPPQPSPPSQPQAPPPGAYDPSYEAQPPPMEPPQSLIPPSRQDWQGAPGAAQPVPPGYAEPRQAPGYAEPPAYGEPPSPAYPEPRAGAAAMQLPADTWRGMDAGAMQTLLQQTPLPSPSPALAKLIASALAAGTPYDDREIAVRADALKKGGRVNELTTLLRVQADSLGQGNGESGGAASPVALFFLAQDENEEPDVRLAAAERAAALNIIDGDALGRAYRETAAKLPKSAKSPAALRAKLFASLDAQGSDETRAESVDALFASGKDAGIAVAIAEALAATSAGLTRAPEARRYADTGIRVAALAGEDQAAWTWVEAGGDRVRSFELLLGAVDPHGGRARAALESGVEIATRSQLPGTVLQRLVTVLDALGDDVPIPLWDFASRTPPPQDGYLPETGVLSALKEAADRGETGRAILLAAIAIGPKGPQDTHLIALGDAIRALKRVGLDAEARRIALEALIPHWPSRGKG